MNIQPTHYVFTHKKNQNRIKMIQASNINDAISRLNKRVMSANQYIPMPEDRETAADYEYSYKM